MEFLLLIVLAAFVFIAFLQGGKHFASPWFLLCLVTFASYSLILMNYENWQVVIYDKFVIYLCSALLFFGLGCVVVAAFSPKKSTAAALRSPEEAGLSKRYPLNLFLVVSIVCAALHIAKLFIDAGGTGSIGERLRHIYSMKVDGYTPGFLFNQMMEIVVAIAYLNVFRLLQRIYSKDDRIGVIRLIIPIAVCILMFLIITDRNKLLRFAIYVLALYVFFFCWNCNRSHKNLRLLMRLAFMFLIAVFMFFLFGVAKQYTSGFTRAVSIYGGSGLYNFNLWLHTFDGNYTYGTATFSTLIHTVEVLFHQDFALQLAPTYDPLITFVSPNGYGYSSNIYSALMPYVQDFGYFGVMFLPFVTGMFFQFLYTLTRKKRYGFSTVLYCALIYQTIYYPIAEQLFRRWELGLLYEIGWLAILFYFVYYRRAASAVMKVRTGESLK